MKIDKNINNMGQFLLLFTIALLMINIPSVCICSVGVGGLSSDFLRLGVGVRGTILGCGFTALSNDSSALDWNPGGLVTIAKPQLMLLYTPLEEQTIYQTLTFSYPLSLRYGFGVGIIRLDSGGFKKYTDSWETSTSQEFKITQTAYIVSSGYLLMKGLSFGITGKYIVNDIYIYHSDSFSFDIGALYRIPFIYGLQVGINIKNVVSSMLKYTDSGTEIPYSTDPYVGISYILPEDMKDVNITLVSGVYKRGAQNLKFSVGMESRIKNIIYLRLGYYNDNVSLGVSGEHRNYSIDFGMSFHELGTLYRIGVNLKFGLTAQEIEEEIEEIKYRDKKIVFTRDIATKLAKKYYLQGIAYCREEEYEKARTAFDTALLWDPENMKILQKLKETERKVNNLNTDRLMNQIMMSGKHSSEIQDILLRGDKLFSANKYMEAINEWERVLKIEPKNREARARINDAKKIIDDELIKLYNDGIKMYNSKDYVGAIKNFNRIISINHRYKNVRKWITLARKQSELIKNSELKETCDKMYYQAVDLYLENKYDEANNLVDTLLEKDPGHEGAQKLKNKISNLISGKEN